MGRLAGQRALVTGASSGIGAATAQQLAREGADVALLARSQKGLRAVAQRVEDQGVRAFRVHADVAGRDGLERAVARASDRLGGVDVAVVAAAAAAFGRFQEMPPDDFDRCVSVSFTGAVDTIRAVLPHLERSAGRLVVVGSASDTVALSLLSPYVAAKSALDGFVESLRAELRSEGSSVSVSLVRPGAIEPRASVTIGGLTLLLQPLNTVARPVTELAMAVVSRIARTRATPDQDPSALWEPSGDGTVSGGLKGRPSVYAALRLGRWRR